MTLKVLIVLVIARRKGIEPFTFGFHLAEFVNRAYYQQSRRRKQNKL
jgi:hypothetical protein